MTPQSDISAVGEKGYTLLELLVTLGISSVIFLAVINLYSVSVTFSHDHQVRIATQVQAQAIMQTIGSELRVLGNGVPFDQANFDIGELTLVDPSVTYPIDIANTTASQIVFRLNETGEVHILTAAFDPSAALTITLTEIGNLAVGDQIYISNSVVGGDDGLYGVLTAVNSATNTITIAGTYDASPGATFAMGSTLEEVPLITYNSPNDGTGITRNSGPGNVALGAGSTLALEYLDYDGNAVALPLTESKMINNLRAVRVSVTLASGTTLKDGSSYSATVQQVYALRNFTYAF